MTRSVLQPHGFALTALVVAVGISREARADDVDDLQALLGENVVSGASKSAEVASDAPATTTNITAEEMRRYGIRSLDEAINFLGMGLVTQNPLHSVEVGGRGVLLTADFGNHVLLVVDGHVFNEPWNGTAYFEQGAGVPFDLIDHVELILGPGSVLYGGSAMFGVINVVTKRASSYKNLHVLAEGSASPEQGTHGNVTSFAPGDLGGAVRLSSVMGKELELFGKQAELMVGVELYHQNGPSFAWRPQTVTNEDGSPASFGPKTAPGIWGGRTREQYRTTVPSAYGRFLLGDLTVMARAASYQRSTPYSNAFNQFFSDFDDPRGYERDQWLSLDVQHRGRFGKLSTLARVYGDRYAYRQAIASSEGSHCPIAVEGGCSSRVTGFSQWLGVELQGKYDWTGDDRLTTMLGADSRVRNLGGNNDTFDAAGGFVGTTNDNEVTEGTTSVYGQQRWSPHARLHLNGGARFDVDPRGGNRVSPRAAIVVEPWKDGVLKTIYAEAFRAPSFYEAFYEAATQPRASGLRSEVVRSLEASLEQKVGRHRLLMGVFRTWWSDMIGLAALPDGNVQYQNFASVDNVGYNARVEGSFGEARYGLSVTGADTDRSTQDGNAPLPVAPQLFGNARVSYDLPDALPTVALASSFVAKRPADRAFDGNFAVSPYAPASMNLRLTLSEKMPGLPALSYRIAADWVTATKSAYVAGPNQFIDPAATDKPTAALAPQNRFTGFVTLTYELPL